MKISIIGFHFLLGLLLIFYGFNTVAGTLTRENNTDWPLEFIEEKEREAPYDIAGGFMVAILGVISIMGSLAMRKDRPWADGALLLVTLALSMIIIFSTNYDPGGEDWGLDFFQAFFGFAIFIIFLIEILFIYLMKRSNQLH